MNRPQLPFDGPEASPDRQNGEPSPVFNIRDVVDQVLDQYQKAINGENHDIGLATGIQQLDRMLGGLMPGLHILASRPSMGKTTLMLNIVEHLSVGKKVACLIFSGALDSYQIVRRMTFSRARLSPVALLSAITQSAPPDNHLLDFKVHHLRM
jgi:replicative DNA helicase